MVRIIRQDKGSCSFMSIQLDHKIAGNIYKKAPEMVPDKMTKNTYNI